ncbi:type IX secretion system ring subunit PorN/GldN [Porphyromonas circumdentaria]|uniref:Gliding motility associated protien GldN n=1 Tax=Porphyromonas circumdentaria TaxID=29524 RepID=A0A1T4KW59_9PORP|nr:gliding motility protein GldN [Porphyromonas circumdentaria]MBB6275096.1 gliding motility associated protein GldN [Porphyromonas circumdentaria]SJZ46547.1 gliding motility associated protien GldN [Porphyromonas circumdentaria]
MKNLSIKILASLLAFLPLSSLFAQTDTLATENSGSKVSAVRRVTSARRDLKKEQPKEEGLSVRAQEFNKRLRNDSGNTPWKRIIYRELSLDSAANTALYYPPRPTQEEQNLFSTIFKLLAKGAIKAYDYVDGYEIFDAQHELKLGDFLDRFGILYTENSNAQEAERYTIAPADIPSDLVKSYFIKEEYYFDPIRGIIDTRVLALCPILFETGDLEETLRLPLFWVTYESIRPYLSTLPVMLSDVNNAMQSTMDNYFRMRLYKGEIYKTRNRLGRALVQYCPTPDSLQKERMRIEQELASFEKALWQQKESVTEETSSETTDTTEGKKESKEGETARARRQQQKEGKVSKKKTKAPKQPKTKKSTSSSTKRSARNRF